MEERFEKRILYRMLNTVCYSYKTFHLTMHLTENNRSTHFQLFQSKPKLQLLYLQQLYSYNNYS